MRTFIIAVKRLWIPTAAVIAIIIALVAFPEQVCEDICSIGLTSKLNMSSFTCLTLAVILFSYWLKVDGIQLGNDILQYVKVRIRKILAARTGIPAKVLDALAKGVLFMWKAIKARAMQMAREESLQKGLQQGREEGRQQTSKAYQSWIQRQRQTGNLTVNESDPPPD